MASAKHMYVPVNFYSSAFFSWHCKGHGAINYCLLKRRSNSLASLTEILIFCSHILFVVWILWYAFPSLVFLLKFLMNDVWKRVSIKRKAIEYKIHRMRERWESITYRRGCGIRRSAEFYAIGYRDFI